MSLNKNTYVLGQPKKNIKFGIGKSEEDRLTKFQNMT